MRGGKRACLFSMQKNFMKHEKNKRKNVFKNNYI